MYVAFLDADDEWRPEFLRRTTRFLQDHPEAVAVSTAFLIRYLDGREVVGPATALIEAPEPEGTVLRSFFDFWARHDHVRTGTILIRRAVIEQAGYQRADLRISQDLEYWAYIATFGPLGFLPEPLWIGNSRAAAAKSGWIRRYSQRRRMCPSVEQWQTRIVPRLSPRDLEGFETARGRVAAGLVHHMILGGAGERALETIEAFGPAMPRGRLVSFMRAAASGGRWSWTLACVVVRAREYAKAFAMSLRMRIAH